MTLRISFGSGIRDCVATHGFERGSSAARTSSIPIRAAVAVTIALALIDATVGRAASFFSTDQLGGDVDHPIEFLGVSGDGRTVVGSRGMPVDFDPLYQYEAVRWTADEGLVSLGWLPGGMYEGRARAASEDGSTIVGAGDTAIDVPGPEGEPTWGGFNAFEWRDETGMLGLDGDRPDVERVLGGYAVGISANGGTIVGSRVIESGYDHDVILMDHRTREAVVWRDGQAPLLLGTLETERSPWFPYDHGSFATGVSADGSIVVGTTDSDDVREAFVWDEVHGMRGLGRLPSDDFSYSGASAISDDGRTIVGTNVFVDRRTFVSRSDGFIYTEATGLRRIPDLSEHWSRVRITDVSGDGSVVIGSGNNPLSDYPMYDGPSEAFIWDAEHGVRTLKDVLASLGIALPGWDLTAATAISRDGRTIVGQGRDPSGARQSYVAVIPEPGTAVLVATGLIALALQRRRREPPL